MTNQEKVLHIRKVTMAPMGKIKGALEKTNYNVDEAMKELEKQMTKTDIADIAHRAIDATIVYSYVHNNKIGAMITMGCQTDFTAKNETFLNLAKDICIHIVSSPTVPEYVSLESIPVDKIKDLTMEYQLSIPSNKPPQVVKNIVDGKLNKFYSESCLLNQKFVKNDTITIKQLIQSVSSVVGEQIEVKKFIRMTTNG
jgi:elongation factor Ts